MGHKHGNMEFSTPNGNKQIASTWYTTLKLINKKILFKDELIKNYTKEEYPNYDNYDAINVSKTKNIPGDYFNTMGVPMTYLLKHNPYIFNIIGITRGWDINESRIPGKKYNEPQINGKKLFPRVLIIRKKDIW